MIAILDNSSFKIWDPWKLVPQIVTIFLTTIIISIIALIYFLKVKKASSKKAPKGIVLLVEISVKGVESMVVNILGQRFKGLTLYFLYLLAYIIVGNLLGILGFESQMTSYTTTFSMGLITFIGIYVFGIKFQKLSFFKKYLNPLEFLTQFAPLISISFRLFGNILGGSIIMTLLYAFTAHLSAQVPVVGQVNFLIAFFAPLLHFYFDVFFGVIQAFIFAILTLVYWKMQMVQNTSENEEKVIIV